MGACMPMIAIYELTLEPFAKVHVTWAKTGDRQWQKLARSDTTFHDMPKHLRNVLSILKPQSARGTAITSPQLQYVPPGERDDRDSGAPLREPSV